MKRTHHKFVLLFFSLKSNKVEVEALLLLIGAQASFSKRVSFYIRLTVLVSSKMIAALRIIMLFQMSHLPTFALTREWQTSYHLGFLMLKPKESNPTTLCNQQNQNRKNKKLKTHQKLSFFL